MPPTGSPAHPVVSVLTEHPESDHLSPASPPWHWLPPLMAWMPTRAQTRPPASAPPSTPHGRPCPSHLVPHISPPPPLLTPSHHPHLLTASGPTGTHPSAPFLSQWLFLNLKHSSGDGRTAPPHLQCPSSRTVSLSRFGEPTALTHPPYCTTESTLPSH